MPHHRRTKVTTAGRIRRTPRVCALIVAALSSFAPAAYAEPILAADPALDALAASYERQQDSFARVESGMSFDSHIKPDQVQVVRDFFAAGQDKDFKTFSGKHPFEVIESYDEHGDMGNFSGIASVGLAARLMVLKRDGADATTIAGARDACVRAARTWHVFASIAGPTVVARGVRRVTPLAGEPALPGVTPPLVPLKDGSGNPLPAGGKPDTWRAPVAPGFEQWIWRDNSSKDQVAGYALAALWLWDALREDAAAPKDVVDALAVDLARFAKELTKVNPENGVDLCVRDADGRLTSFGDLNGRIISGTSGAVLPEDSLLVNGFNAALALAIVRAAVRMSGDVALRTYYLDDLVGRREYPRHAAETATLLYQGEQTNFSNVNMLAIALATIGRIETNKDVRARLTQLIDKFWDSGDSRSALHAKQPWFDVIVAGFGGAPRPEVHARIREQLVGYPAAPTFQRDRTNCDAGEIAARSCVAVDGTTILTLSTRAGRGGSVVATSAVPIGVRPDTNFAWRSDPFAVNGGASNLLNPRGDWLAAYWLARLLDRDPTKNVLPLEAAEPLPSPPDGGAGDSEAPDGGTGGPGDARGDGDSGCGCSLQPSEAQLPALFGLLGVTVLAARRRRRRR